MSSIKNILYSFMLSSLILLVVFTLVPGIDVSGQPLHWLMAFGAITAAYLIVPQALKFFTLPQNIITNWVVGILTGFIAIYCMDLFLPGIHIGETLIDPVSMGVVSINPFTLSSELTALFAAIVAGLLNAIFFWLKQYE